MNSTSNYELSTTANDDRVSENFFSNIHGTLLLWIIFGFFLILQIWFLILSWIYTNKRRECQSIIEQYKSNSTVDTWKVPSTADVTQTKFEVVRVTFLPKKQNLIQHQFEHCMTNITQSIVLDYPGDLQPSYSWVYQPNDDAISIFI